MNKKQVFPDNNYIMNPQVEEAANRKITNRIFFYVNISNKKIADKVINKKPFNQVDFVDDIPATLHGLEKEVIFLLIKKAKNHRVIRLSFKGIKVIGNSLILGIIKDHHYAINSDFYSQLYDVDSVTIIRTCHLIRINDVLIFKSKKQGINLIGLVVR